MLLTVHLAHPTMPLTIANEMPDMDAERIAAELENGVWVTLPFPAGSSDRVKVNPAFVTHVQLVT